MEHIYALGVTCIESVQYWFADWAGYFEFVNHLANPHYVLEILFPLISIVDSVFASQLLLCIAFSGWVNGLLKWRLLEDRPYWWVQETSYYANTHRPQLLQTSQSCEAGPGSPSGHTLTAASVLILAVMWCSHVFNDRKWNVSWWKAVMFPTFGFGLGSVMLARMFVATHFPHQCLLGALLGLFMAPGLCIYMADPFIWRYSSYRTVPVKKAVALHAGCALLTIIMTVVTYYSHRLSGTDPDSTVQLAQRWCENSENIHVSTTPLYALVQSTSALMGWALFVTPAVAEYRHYTKNRSLVISIFATGLSIFLLRRLNENIVNTGDLLFYSLKFIMNVIKPALFLRVVPALAMWPYSVGNKMKTN